MLGNPEHAIHRADCTTHTRADRTSDDRADRTGSAPALAGTFLRAADNALRMPEMGYRQQGQCDRGGCQMKLVGKAARQRQRPDLRLFI